MSQIRSVLVTGLILTMGPVLFAQVPNETDTTATPAPGDHNYVTSPVETVNPANGSVSVRIPVRIDPGRGLTVPFTIAYDSNGSFYVVPWGNGPEYRGATTATGTQGGWSYTYPLLSFSGTTWQIPGSGDRMITCHGSYNYVFQDANGDRHNLGLSVEPNVASPDGYDNCNNGPPGEEDGEYTTGGEGPILATTSIPGGNTGDFPPVYVDEPDGTGYYFSGGGPGTNTLTEFSPTISDRNGNTVSLSENGSQVTYTDAIGRNVLTVSGLGGSPDNISAAGLSSSYQVYWTTASASFTDNMVNLEPGVEQNCPTAESASAAVVSQVVLPNGQSFYFSYDPTYGMLTKIVYPGGGYVRYVWGLNPQAEAGLFIFNVNGTPTAWTCRYDFPAITDRYVSYDGQTEVLHQHFSYSTQWTGNNITWNEKTTSVTTTDLTRTNASYTTSYTYSGLNSPWVPNCQSCNLTAQIPVENTIQYNDYGGGWLQTVTKNWKNIRLVQSEQTMLNNSTSSLKVFCYTNWEQQQEEDDYDLGTGNPSGTCASVPSGTASGALLRKTVTNYASFSGHIVDLPSSVVVSDGSGNRVAETDYPSYDGNGNLKTKTVDCFSVPGGQPCPQGNSTTTYQYDANGQMTTMTDPNQNPSTSYSYADNYSSCGGSAPPQSPSDAYLTQITYPSVNGVAHTVSYCYDYASGLLLSASTDGRPATTYAYTDPFLRLTSVTRPDGGSTTYSYNDPGLRMTTITKLSSSQQKSTVTFLNGLGAPYETELTSDPYGLDYQVTALDGLGRPYQVTNPYRSTSDPTYGVTTYTYDALGRTTSVLNPDSTSATTQYSGNCTTSTDESNKKRESCSDGLGRVTTVFEDPSGLNYETDYTYDGNSNLVQVDQWGGPRGSNGERRRDFIYDSMSKLTNACNPETIPTGSSCSSSGPWSDTYTYDDNGNLTSSTDARSDTVQYYYDALNRTESQVNPSGTANACFWYDTTSVSSPPTGCSAPPSNLTTGSNLVDNMAYQWTSDDETGTGFGYDVMGRTTSRTVCTPSTCPGSTRFNLGFQYDLAGDLLSYSNGEGVTITENYDGALHLSSVTSSLVDSTHPGTLWTANSYNAIGLTGATFGNDVTESLGYDTRQRLTSQNYQNSSQVLYQYGLGYFADSSVQSLSDSSNGNWTYSMDSLNRLYTATATSGPYNGTSLQWGYDAFGNRATQTATAGSAPQPQFSMNTNNQIVGYCYDSAGNLTDEGSCPQPGYTHQFTYDGAGHLVSPDYGNTTYVYNASGSRVAKRVSGSSTYEYLYDVNGNQITELTPAGWNRGEVYAAGIHVATYIGNTTYFAGTDWLSDEREHSRLSGEQEDTCANLPFGDDLEDCPIYGVNPFHFTGKERDSESGNDYFPARYYGSAMGRFLSPDDGNDPDRADPQSWNLYSYVQNNPLTNIDPSGQDCVTDNGDGTATINSGDCSGKNSNNEYYYDCGDGNDGCLLGTTSANMTSNGSLALYNANSNTISTISNYGDGSAGGGQDFAYGIFSSAGAQYWRPASNVVQGLGATELTVAGFFSAPVAVAGALAGCNSANASCAGNVALAGLTGAGVLGRGLTGARAATTIAEQLALEEAAATPSAGKTLTNIVLKDPRWPATAGWVKKELTSPGGVVVHWVYNTITGAAADFKLK